MEYIALAVPLIYVIGRIQFWFNANSPSLHGFVLVAQLLSQTYSTKTILIDAIF